jgi:RNA recognition motif-containing protein
MNIYISNLSYAINDGDLKELFENFGQVSSAKVIMDRETGKSKGFGFVEMPDATEAQKAITELNQGEYDGKVINVAIAKPREERPKGGGFRSGGFRSGGGGGYQGGNRENRGRSYGNREGGYNREGQNSRY